MIKEFWIFWRGEKNVKQEDITEEDRDLRFYYTVQEVLFTEIILNKEKQLYLIKAETFKKNQFYPNKHD